jgi:gamma-glutamylcyclotransferase (GGCT)/AIG2-like uncharacterized protein YtfP
MAEREGFEPPIELPLCRISSAVHSTTLPSLREIDEVPCRGPAGRHGGAYDIAIDGSQHLLWPFITLGSASMLFVYGTLQDPDVLGAVLGRPADMVGLRPATAPGYRVVFYPGRVYPALVAASEATASGLLIEGLSALDLAVLDAFEGDEYRRKTIAVHAAGQQRRVGTYLPTILIGAGAPAWSLAAWTALHKPAVIGGETTTALRQRLSARQAG